MYFTVRGTFKGTLELRRAANECYTNAARATNVHDIAASLIQQSRDHVLNGSIPAPFRAIPRLHCTLLLVVRFAAFCSSLSTSRLANSRRACGWFRLAACCPYSLRNVGFQYLARGRNKRDILTNGRAWAISELLINWDHATFLVSASYFTCIRLCGLRNT
jgi:hypothetical protein